MKYVILKNNIVSEIYDNPEQMYASFGDEYLEMTDDELISLQRDWRNNELKKTDFIVPLIDFPNHSDWMTYRQDLRDWTISDDFPIIKPIMPTELI